MWIENTQCTKRPSYKRHSLWTGQHCWLHTTSTTRNRPTANKQTNSSLYSRTNQVSCMMKASSITLITDITHHCHWPVWLSFINLLHLLRTPGGTVSTRIWKLCETKMHSLGINEQGKFKGTKRPTVSVQRQLVQNLSRFTWKMATEVLWVRMRACACVWLTQLVYSIKSCKTLVVV